VLGLRGLSSGCVGWRRRIFFGTTTWRGRLVRLFESRDDEFAHVGVIVGVEGDARVVHADPTGAGAVRLERLSELLRREEISSIAIYHPRVRDAEAARAAKTALKYASSRTPFDFEFSLTDDHAVYCTELVWLLYRTAGLRIERSSHILFPSDLLQNWILQNQNVQRATHLLSVGPLAIESLKWPRDNPVICSWYDLEETRNPCDGAQLARRS